MSSRRCETRSTWVLQRCRQLSDCIQLGNHKKSEDKGTKVKGEKYRRRKKNLLQIKKNNVLKNIEVGITLSISTDFHALIFYFLSTHQDLFLSLTDKVKLLLEIYEKLFTSNEQFSDCKIFISVACSTLIIFFHLKSMKPCSPVCPLSLSCHYLSWVFFFLYSVSPD